MARLNVTNRVQRGFWRALEAVGVKNARSRWEAQSPFLQRAVPPLVIAALVLVIAWAAGVPPHPTLLALLAVVYALYLLPRACSEDRFAADGAGDCPRLPDPVGERAERNQRVVRDPRLQGLPEHGHDGRDRHLRDDGDRAEHGRRLRGPARSRLRRLLRDRRLHGGLVRLSALQLEGRLRVRRDRRAGRDRRDPHLDLARPPHRRGHHSRRRRSHRLANAPAEGRLSRHRHARLRRDHPPGRAERRRRRDQRASRYRDGLQPHERRLRHQPGRSAGLRRLAVGQARAARELHRRERLVRELRQPHLLVGDRALADHGLLQPPAARLAARAARGSRSARTRLPPPRWGSR